MATKENTNKGKAGKAGTYTAGGFVPSKQKTEKKPITIIDILLGRK